VSVRVDSAAHDSVEHAVEWGCSTRWNDSDFVKIGYTAEGTGMHQLGPGDLLLREVGGMAE